MPAINVTQVLQMATGAHARGQLSEAERLYRQVLAVDTKQPDALHLLGILFHQTGRTAAGIDLIRKAIEIAPRMPMYHANLAMVFRGTSQFALEAECLQNALAIDPQNGKFYLRLGYLFSNELNRPAKAIEIYQAALAIDSKSFDALFGLGLALHRLGDIPAALEVYQRARELAPNDTDLLSNFAAALLAQGESNRAIEMYNSAIALAPDKALLWYNLGFAHMSVEATEPAIQAFEKSLALNPNDMMSRVNLAAMLRARGDVNQAAEMYMQLIQQHPGIAELHNNLGLTRQAQGRQHEAIAAMRQAVALNPLGVMVYDNLLMALQYQCGISPDEVYAEHRKWGELIESKITPRILKYDASRRLRVGYVSPDFRQHSVSYFIEPIVAGHNRRGFEVFCYANQPVTDATTTRLRSQADHWRNIYKLSDDAAADLIQQDQIDILIDLAVHSQGNRLPVFAQKPAQLQGTYLGYAGTTGLRAIDFRITDNQVDPPGASEAQHTEKLVRLPDTQWVYRPPREAGEVSPLPADKNGYVTFGVATNLAKINDQTIAMWGKTLQATPDSRLILKGASLEDSATRQYFLDLFANAGVDRTRIQFEPSASLSDYFQFFSRIDLVLDTFPFGGGTTSCHALYMGVPIITRTGETSVSRVGASLLHNVGLVSLIADSMESFVRIATDLSLDRTRLRHIRSTLRQVMQASPLMDEKHFVQNLELAYSDLWKEWCATHP